MSLCQYASLEVNVQICIIDAVKVSGKEIL